jgi:hypothetical protein
MHDLLSENRSKARHQFLFWCFVAGACAPAVWFSSSYALAGSWSVSSGSASTLLFALACATFPTQVFFLDAEHLPQIIFMLVIAMPVNGAWFAVVGLGFWYLREGLSRLKRRSIQSRQTPD